ncbi:hypothetical protein, partial [Helicobacter bilis]
ASGLWNTLTMHIREKQWLQRQYNRVFASAGQYPRECGFVKKKKKCLSNVSMGICMIQKDSLNIRKMQGF